MKDVKEMTQEELILERNNLVALLDGEMDEMTIAEYEDGIAEIDQILKEKYGYEREYI